MKARFVSTAERELKEAMEFYESARQGLGAEFLAEVEATTHLISFSLSHWLGRHCRPARAAAAPAGSLRPFLSSATRRNPDRLRDGFAA